MRYHLSSFPLRRCVIQSLFPWTRPAAQYLRTTWVRLQPAMTRMSTTSRDHLSTLKYAHIEEVERLERYHPGGYHPLEIGDTIGTRYRVIRKLGYGTFSTTWLCWDQQSSSYVAVKIGTRDSNPRETEILDHLNSDRNLPDHPGMEMIPTTLDRFDIHGPNGSHPCYATEPAMCSISGAKDGSYNRLFQASTARSLAAQLVLVVGYVHARGVVHGDPHLGNLMLRLPTSFDELSVEQLYKKFGKPSPQPVVRLDGKALTANVPPNATPPIWLAKASDKFSPSEVRVLLTDFGQAYSPSNESRYESHAPLSASPPEVRFERKRGLSFPSDVWSLACVIWAILGQRPLFEEFLATPDDILAEQVDVIGELPLAWWENWQARDEYFSGLGEPTGRHVRYWDDRFETHIQRPRREAGISEFGMEEKRAVMNMLRSMFSFKPERRSTAQEILESEWMVKWALPEYKSHDL